MKTGRSREIAQGGRAIGGGKIGGRMGSTLAAAAMSAFALGAGAVDNPAQANVAPQERLGLLRRYELGRRRSPTISTLSPTPTGCRSSMTRR